MRLDPTQRKAALDQMPEGHYSRRMFFLGLKLAALTHEHHTLTIGQQQRMTELRTDVERILANQQRSNMRGRLALQIQKADATFNDIMGEDWHPRDDNPIQRQCREQLLTSL